jgi:hypothetical protein
MTRARFLIFAGIAAIAAAAVLYASRDASPPTEFAPASTSPAVPAPAPAAAAPVSNPTSVNTPRFTAANGTRPRDPMATNFEATDDLLAFVDGIQDAAQNGDGAAAYFLYQTLERCETEYGKRFGSGRRERSLDEVMTDESIVRQFGVEDLRRIHGQCQRLRESDITRFGASDDWLMKAADAGYPRAQAQVALWFVLRGGPPDTDWRGPAREFARAALRSKDPEVFLTVSRVVEGLKTEGAANQHSGAGWYIAACLRGLDCGPGAELTRKLCDIDPTCHPNESAIDLLRRIAGERFEAAERDARDINDAIDAGRLDELGL